MDYNIFAFVIRAVQDNNKNIMGGGEGMPGQVEERQPANKLERMIEFLKIPIYNHSCNN